MFGHVEYLLAYHAIINTVIIIITGHLEQSYRLISLPRFSTPQHHMHARKGKSTDVILFNTWASTTEAHLSSPPSSIPSSLPHHPRHHPQHQEGILHRLTPSAHTFQQGKENEREELPLERAAAHHHRRPHPPRPTPSASRPDPSQSLRRGTPSQARWPSSRPSRCGSGLSMPAACLTTPARQATRLWAGAAARGRGAAQPGTKSAQRS